MPDSKQVTLRTSQELEGLLKGKDAGIKNEKKIKFLKNLSVFDYNNIKFPQF